MCIRDRFKYTDFTAGVMFCPACGTLSFPDPNGIIKCPNYECGYHGTAENKIQIGDEEVDISKATSSSKSEARDRRVIEDADQMRGVLTTNTTSVQNVTQIKSTQNFNKHVHLMNQRPEF